jgi:hypothetical protein
LRQHRVHGNLQGGQFGFPGINMPETVAPIKEIDV